MKNNSNVKTLLNGILFENPVFILILGTCPTLATTTNVTGAIAMGLATTAVLICSNFVISLLKKLIPNTVRIPCYIVIQRAGPGGGYHPLPPSAGAGQPPRPLQPAFH